MLLPLSAAVARKKCLEHHLALASLQAGNGTPDALSKVFQTIYLAYFVHEATVGRHDLDQFRAAEAAVVDCAVAGKKAGVFEIPAASRAAVEPPPVDARPTVGERARPRDRNGPCPPGSICGERETVADRP